MDKKRKMSYQLVLDRTESLIMKRHKIKPTLFLYNKSSFFTTSLPILGGMYKERV